MNRRDFLKEVGTIGAAGIALSLFPWLEACTDKAKKDIKGEKARLAILGTGSRGVYHINNLLYTKTAEIVALCDDYQPHLENARALCPEARTYNDYRRLLEDQEVDGIIICTPLYLHAEMTIAALSAGKHVLCEKALAYNIEDCKRVYDKWKASGQVLMVGQQRLYDPKYIKAMEMIHEGAIGEVVGVRNYWFRNNDWRRPVPSPDLERRINWRLYDEYSRGLMTELACHQLQNGTWAVKQLPKQVMGSGSIIHWKDGREVYDNVSVIYTFPNGINMTFESIISNKHYGMGEQILGSKGTIELTKGRIYSEEPRPKSGIRQLIGQIENGIFENSVFAGTSWAAEDASSDAGTLVIPNAKSSDGSSSVGAIADGSEELVEAFCHAVITSRQPERVTEESYYASVYSLLGDDAMHNNSILELAEEYRIPYQPQ